MQLRTTRKFTLYPPVQMCSKNNNKKNKMAFVALEFMRQPLLVQFEQNTEQGLRATENEKPLSE